MIALRTLPTWYQRQMNRRPLATQAISTGVLFGMGDIISQVFLEKRRKYSVKQTIRFFLYGTFILGPAVSGFYALMDKHITGNRASSLLKRIAIDQLVFAPISLAVLFIFNGICERRSLDQIGAGFNKVYFGTLISNWKIWPMIQLLNFGFVPLNYRVIVVNVISIGWNAYLCFVNSKAGNVSVNPAES